MGVKKDLEEAIAHLMSEYDPGYDVIASFVQKLLRGTSVEDALEETMEENP